jgi:hypothetical protein
MQIENSRTSVTLPQPLLQRAKKAAAKHKTSVNQLLLEGLQKKLAELTQTKTKASIPLSSLAGSIQVKKPIPAQNLRDHLDYQS